MLSPTVKIFHDETFKTCPQTKVTDKHQLTVTNYFPCLNLVIVAAFLRRKTVAGVNVRFQCDMSKIEKQIFG